MRWVLLGFVIAALGAAGWALWFMLAITKAVNH